MGLLAPWFLFGLVAVAGPILAHLRRKRVQRRVAFSAVEFLDPRPPRTAHRQWEDVALMALRMLVLGLFAFAFARPYLPVAPVATGAVAGAEARRVVVLMDTSASMRRGTLFERAVAQAQAAIDRLGPDDALEIRAFDRSTRVLLGFEQWRNTPLSERAPLVRSLLAGLKPGWAATLLDEALREAVEQHLAEAGPGFTQALVVSDFQEGASLVGLQGMEWPPRFAVTCLPVEEAASAAGVALHWLPPDPDAATSEDPLKVQAVAGPEFRGETVRLVLEGAHPLERVVPVAPGKARLVSFSTKEPYARIRVADATDFAGAVWAARVPQRRALVVVVGAADPADRTASPYFVLNALRALGDARVEALPSAALPRDREREVSLWILCGRSDASALERVRLSVANGATAMLLLNATADGGVLPALGVDAPQLEEKPVEGFAVLGAIERAHPLFAAFASPQFSDFTGIRFWKYRKLEVPVSGATTVLARFEGGDPALVEYATGKGRILVWTSDWRPADGQWVLSSRCVPFLASCLEWAGGGRRSFLTGNAGESFVLPAGTTAVRAGDGRALAFSGESVLIDEPGVYQIEPSGGLVVVNVAPGEVRTAPLEKGKLEALGVPVHRADTEPAEQGDARSAREVNPETLAIRELEARQGGWRIVLAVVFVLILLETLWASRLTRIGKAAV